MKAALATDGWFAQVKAWPIADVASRFGLELVKRGLDVSFTCPACGKELRHKADRRRSAKVMEGDRWWCEPCGSSGDGVSLAAVKVTGHVKPATPSQWADVRRECAGLGLCDAAPGDAHPNGVRYQPPARPVVVEVKPERPPATELGALWGSCLAIGGEPAPGAEWGSAARGWLDDRGYDWRKLEALGVARVLPSDFDCEAWPAWWPSGWSHTHRLGVPLYDAQGSMVSLQARAIASGDPKTRNPKGCALAGTFFADSGGLGVLRGAFGGPTLAVVEGLTDFLAAAQLVADLEPGRRPAVLGIVAGSAREMARLALAPSTRLIVLTDNDETGEKYFREVTKALPGLNGSRVRLPSLDGTRADLSDYLKRYPNRALEALLYEGRRG